MNCTYAVYRLIQFIPIFALFLISNASNCLGQRNDTLQLVGYVYDQGSKEAIPYVKIAVKSTRTGTLSNLDGYFKLGQLNADDTLILSASGYESLVFAVDDNVQNVVLFLHRKYLELDEVVAGPGDQSRLYALMNACKKNQPNTPGKAKAYSSLRSYKDGQQLEMMEAFFNLSITGYDLKEFDLKAGRLALAPYKNRFFTSRALTKAISSHRMFRTNKDFPASPFDISLSDLKKSYYLTIQSTFVNEQLDSIYILQFTPKDSSGLFYAARAWINLDHYFIEKMELSCETCENHPFAPLFPTDSISKVAMKLTRSFERSGKKLEFARVDFTYKVDYKSRIGSDEEISYTIQTEALVLAYDFSEQFHLPHFEFLPGLDDYRKISAFPYNPFFWDTHNEYQLNYADSSNYRFFSDSANITNVTFFRNQGKKLNFEHPFLQWSTNRIVMREMVYDTLTNENSGDIKSRLYNIDIQIFSDHNTYDDSVHIMSAAVFDPYNTYYYLPIDNFTNCFLNMYFDVCEIERRAFFDQLPPALDYEAFQIQLAHFHSALEKKMEQFKKDVERGTNSVGMDTWNKYIIRHLGIDNVQFFQLTFERVENKGGE